MPNHFNVLLLRPNLGAAERFHDCCIAEAAGHPKAKAVENHVHAIRITSIDHGSISASRATTELGGQGQLERKRHSQSAFRKQLRPSGLSPGSFPR